MNTNDASEKDPSIIDAGPTKDLFISILTRDVTLRDAIGDLVDNSIDGAMRLRPDGNFEKLKVKITIDTQKGIFTIQDNCGGIPVDVARDYAFRFGRRKDATKTGHSVGVYGIGMKRALFRLGNWFSVDSIAKDSSFSMYVDVQKWKEEGDGSSNQDEWRFKFQEYKENLKEDYPIEKRGTKIKVKLHPDVTTTYTVGKEIDSLIEELQREHIYSIDQGLSITVNGKHLEAPELKLLVSEDLKPAYWENLDGPVKVRIYAGISEKETFGQKGGWYIFCNKRLVLGPDQTKITGWGVKDPTRIPEYHPQFYRFRGYVFMDAEDPLELPWNTSKTSMDLDSPVYRTVLQKMIVLMRSVIDFLNDVHTEEGDFSHERINEAPLQSAIENANLLPLAQVRNGGFSYVERDVFFGPEPVKSAIPQPTQTFIRFSVSKKEYDLVKEYWGIDKPGEIGRKIFDYFYAREIKR